MAGSIQIRFAPLIRQRIGSPPELARQRLLRSGALRAGINLSNSLLVSQRAAEGEPVGVAPDLAAALAKCLDAPLTYVTYESPGKLAAAADSDEWDIGLLGAEPQRAAVIEFTPAYAEIEATYLVSSSSTLQDIEDVDRHGVQIAVAGRTAYGLWLERNIRAAQLVVSTSFAEAYQDFVARRLDAVAGLKTKLLEEADKVHGFRILPGRFMAVQQAIGAPKGSGTVHDYLSRFVIAAVNVGLIDELISHYGVAPGLSPAKA